MNIKEESEIPPPFPRLLCGALPSAVVTNHKDDEESACNHDNHLQPRPFLLQPLGRRTSGPPFAP